MREGTEGWDGKSEPSSRLNYSFEAWMRMVNYNVEHMAGVNVKTLKSKLDYRDWYDKHLDPYEAAQEAIVQSSHQFLDQYTFPED